MKRSNVAEVDPYEDRLDREREWAMREGSKFFEGVSEIQDALKKIANKLREIGIDYAVVGGMALFQHGYRRFTDDIDLLVTPEGLKEIHRYLDGLGYLPPFRGSKNLRDTEHGVKIEFLVSGEFPGDGKPKPVAFPRPDSVTVEIDGIRYISLPALIELKLASGMTNSERMKDLADVIELIMALDLSSTFADALNPFVQAKYKQLWSDAHPPARRYLMLWRNKGLTAEEKADTLRPMLADGVTLDSTGGTSSEWVRLVTTDPAIAKKYGMHDETEFLADAGETKDDADDNTTDE